jgi:serine phosphatase RsbU (regulator of sigma subunit)
LVYNEKLKNIGFTFFVFWFNHLFGLKCASLEEFSINRTEDSSAADLMGARKVHAAMIPEILPVAEELEIWSLYIPCKHIGGDLFDVVQISDKHHCISGSSM